jgi:cytochrome c553
MEHLAGKRVSKILEEMEEMQFSDLGKNIMNVHAQSYTEDEIKLIADYFSLQK